MALYLILLTHYIYDNDDKSNYVIGVFLDIKKAFDTVNLDLLIRKLHYAEIRSNISKLIKSYLNIFGFSPAQLFHYHTKVMLVKFGDD